MGACLSEQQSRSDNTAPNTNNRNLPTKPANNKKPTKPTPTTPNHTQHKHNNLQPIIRPTLPSALVSPTTNPKLNKENSVIPN
jgi:hypothetical protein